MSQELSWKIDPTPGDYRILNAEGEAVGRFKGVEDVLAHLAFVMQEREGSQELEQAVGEAAAEIQRHSARINMKEGRAAVIAGTDQIEPIILKHLSPLFARLSQRITEWEERWSKDASQSESECRARDKRIEELEAELVELRAWVERAKGPLQLLRNILVGVTNNPKRKDAGLVAALDALLSCSVPGQAADATLCWHCGLHEKDVIHDRWSSDFKHEYAADAPRVGDRRRGWLCDYCWTLYAEYVNGCPRCHFGEPGTGTSVVLVDAVYTADGWRKAASAPGQALECLSHPGPAGEPLTDEEKSRMGLVDGAWPADAGGKESQ